MLRLTENVILYRVIFTNIIHIIYDIYILYNRNVLLYRLCLMKEGEKERRHKPMKEGVFTTLLDD